MGRLTPLVTFDLWNTLLRRTCNLPEELALTLGVDQRTVETVWYSSWFTSPLAIDTFLSALSPLPESRVSFAKARSRLAAAYEDVALIPEWPLQCLGSLAKRGIAAGLVSDCDPLTPAALTQAQLDAYFDSAFLSYERGCTKTTGLFTQVSAEAERRGQWWILHIGDDAARDELALAAGCEAVVSCSRSDRVLAEAHLRRCVK